MTAYGIQEKIVETRELLRYHYEEDDVDSKEVRLILKCSFAERAPCIIKFKQEEGVSAALIEAQVRFSEHLAQCGIPTARFYRTDRSYVRTENIGGYEVYVTIEDFCAGELTQITPKRAEKIGALLAKTHTIAVQDDCHVAYQGLFDPFNRNDLFSYEEFASMEPAFDGTDAIRFAHIKEQYARHMKEISALQYAPRFAVQGDISDCNLFETTDGAIGMFDFNQCCDAVPFCDAVMQGIFVSRLMEYGHPLTAEESENILWHFWRGYQKIRPFSANERKWLPHLYAVITAFWLMNLQYDPHSLQTCIDENDRAGITAHLQHMEMILMENKQFDQ